MEDLNRPGVAISFRTREESTATRHEPTRCRDKRRVPRHPGAAGEADDRMGRQRDAMRKYEKPRDKSGYEKVRHREQKL